METKLDTSASWNQSQLGEVARSCADRVASCKEGFDYFSQPFKHCIIDDFLPKKLADECLKNFPPLESEIWDKSNTPEIEVKLRTKWKSEFDIPPAIVEAVRVLNSAPMLYAFGKILGIEKLIPDAYFAGGGLNVTVRGGMLDVHVDGNYHDATGLNRRVNAIIYLNPGWKPGWGGEFGLYDSTGDVLVKKVSPIFNRLVIFDTHDFSFHGLPDPLNFPSGHARRSIILYYYTKAARPSSQIAVELPHSALWKKKGLTDKQGNKTRKFT